MDVGIRTQNGVGGHLACFFLPLLVQGPPAGTYVHRLSIIILAIFSRFCLVRGSLWAGWLCGTAWLPSTSLSFWPTSPSSETFQWSTHTKTSFCSTHCVLGPGLDTWSWA